MFWIPKPQNINITYFKLNFSNLSSVLILLIFIMFGYVNISFAQTKNLNMSIWTNFENKESFPNRQYPITKHNTSIGTSLLLNNGKLTSELNIGLAENQKIFFDGTYANYKFNKTSIGFGKVYRNWSFSPNTSLILSDYHRPASSIYLKTTNKQSSNVLLSWAGPWSFEVFNAFLKNNLGPRDSMLLGIRTIISPFSNLKIEFLKNSQWGGDGYGKNLSSLLTAAIGNTNEGLHSSINQMAGIGFEYNLNPNGQPFLLYGQYIGEDESGNLPSCFMNLTGFEWDNSISGLNTKLGFEFIDTRIDTSSGGNCGANTAYNNGIYNYTNYDNVIGAPIDTEGKSIGIKSSVELKSNLFLSYSLKNVLINDANWSDHRLSSSTQSGWLNSFNIIFEKNKLNLGARISHQNFTLDKIKSTKGLSAGLYSSITF
jgi:hypothetical protein